MLKGSVTVRIHGGAVYYSRAEETIRGFANRMTQFRIVATGSLRSADNGGSLLFQDAQAEVDKAFDEGNARSKLEGMDIGRVHIFTKDIAGESHVVVELAEVIVVELRIGSNSPDRAERDAAAVAILAYKLGVAIGSIGGTQRLATVVPDDTTHLQKQVRFQ